MKPYRQIQLASTIQQELSQLMLREFDFGETFVTISHVQISNDLHEARVRLSILPYERGLEIYPQIHNRRFELRHKLLKKMTIRDLPYLKFEIEQEKFDSEQNKTLE